MAVVTMRQMLDAGVHFGHQTSRWNPKMKRFIFTERNGIYIIDLQQSLEKVEDAFTFIRDTVAHGGSVLFVGTKRQAQESIVEQAKRVGMPYVSERWLGGMLTNFQTVSKRVARLKELEEIDYDDVAGSGRTKKELLNLRREMLKLEKSLGGIRDMTKTPSIVWVVDSNKEHLAVEEASKLGIPVVGILDSNCDPDKVQYGIPGNDDAIRSVGLLTRVVADAVAEGLKQRAAAAVAGDADAEDAEPLAEWEQELLDGASEDSAPAAEGAAEADESKPAAKKPAAKKAPAKKASATKSADEDKPAAKKPAAKKAPAKKAATKTTAKKTKSADEDKPAAKKPAAKKAPAKKAAAKKTTTKKTAASDDAAAADTK